MALLDFHEYVSAAIDSKKHVIGIFIDLQKAFDTIDHSILLQKLYHYGFRGQVLSWLKSYLSDRQQYVLYNNVSSSNKPITCGVPQGSIRGPLLFILYINDIISSSNLLYYILFADDTNLLYSHANILELIKMLIMN